ncbi:hypothetical protein AN958_00018 [Leucoagaricus sp. SymC.cos]|nr:hypothetical protein AN958_00018 [Leucoagaricus sp. SymC.cos]
MHSSRIPILETYRPGPTSSENLMLRKRLFFDLKARYNYTLFKPRQNRSLTAR